MNIYKIIPDERTYGGLFFDGVLLRKTLGRQLSRKLTSVTASIADDWRDCDGWFSSLYDDSDIPVYPDLSVWKGSILVLSERAEACLKKDLSPFGEFLPFTTDKGTFFLFVPHVVVDADALKSERMIEEGADIGPAKIVFTMESVGTNLIFKTEYDQYTSVFCTEKLKTLISKAGLTGVALSQDLV
ncbi:hypothetical protein R50073_29090 [Maricurvus nonylphenolicus]|uniref:hypothetical protein n=1 Tax=Maricurvus nonylphenolicus TaxID=1008307 RepID=UPI0036F1FA57